MLIICLAVLIYLVFFKSLISTKCVSEQNQNVEFLSFSLCGVTLFLYIITEILSLFKGLTFINLILCWGVFLAVGIVGIIFNIKKSDKAGKALIFNKAVFKPSAEKVIVLLFCVIVLLISIFTVTYNWDSMRYHLPRIMSWADHKTVAHYFTNDIRRLSSPVLAEFFNLHEYIFTNSDKFFNLLQAIAFLIGGYYVKKISEQLNLEKCWQNISIILYYSMPIAFAESFSTQLDNFATLWLLIFVYECIKLCKCNKLQKEPLLYAKLVVIGLSGGFGYLTKPSVCIAMAVFAVGLVIVKIAKKEKFKTLLLCLVVTIIPAVLVVLPEVLRNFATFNSYASSSTGEKQLIGTRAPAYVFVNFLKNIGFNLPNNYFYGFSKLFKKAIVKISLLLNVDINNPAISENGEPYVLYNPPEYGHDTAINPIIVWLFIFTTLTAIVLIIKCLVEHRFKKAFKNINNFYLICSFVSFLSLMAVLRWERFETRYEIGFLALLCPYIAYILKKAFGSRQSLKNGIIGIIAFVCIISSVEQIYYHSTVIHSQTNTLSGYFTANKSAYNKYKKLIDEINAKGYKNVGLYIIRGQYSYPFWTMCGNVEKIEDVDGTGKGNESLKYDDKSFVPDCIVWVADLPEGEKFVWHGKEYVKSFTADDCYILEKSF